MKTIEKKATIDKGLPMCKLYLEDIEDIYALLKKEFKHAKKEIKIETDKNIYELKNIEEIKDISEKNEKVNKLEINIYTSGYTYFPYLQILMQKKYPCSIKIDEDTAFARGVLSKLQEVFNKTSKRRKLANVLYWIFNHFAITLALSIPLAFAISVVQRKDIAISITTIMLIYYCFSFTLVGVYGFSHISCSIIYLKPKEASPNFFIRNKDRLILIFITFLVTFVLTKLVEILWNIFK